MKRNYQRIQDVLDLINHDIKQARKEFSWPRYSQSVSEVNQNLRNNFLHLDTSSKYVKILYTKYQEIHVLKNNTPTFELEKYLDKSKSIFKMKKGHKHYISRADIIEHLFMYLLNNKGTETPVYKYFETHSIEIKFNLF